MSYNASRCKDAQTAPLLKSDMAEVAALYNKHRIDMLAEFTDLCKLKAPRLFTSHTRATSCLYKSCIHPSCTMPVYVTM